VDFQVWRTWIITPVANIDPVQLSWATISRVSLHNFDFIQTKQIRNKDFVRVQRSWEVIPYIVWTIKERRNWTEEEIIPPHFCPVCKWAITNIDIHYYCTNPWCPAQIKEKIIHFASRDAMDITWLGESVVDVLVDQGLLHSICDIYTLTDIKNQILLRKFPNFWEKKIAEIVWEIDKSKSKPLWRILNALWIPNVWKKIAQDLATYLKSKEANSLDKILEVFENEQIKDLFWIGNKIMNWILLYISNPDTLWLLRWLEQHGVIFDATAVDEDNSLSISEEDKEHFSLTWSFPVSRWLFVKALENKWFVYDENPNSKTNIMFIWEKPWSKAEKASNLWIKIYNNFDEIKKIFWLEFPTEEKKSKIIQWGLF
jgi:DNA ligase (NAD+)